MGQLGDLDAALDNESLASCRVSANPGVDEQAGLPMMQRGVAVGLLVAFTDHLNLWDAHTCDVVRDVIVPLTDARQCRMVDMPAIRPFTGQAQCFLSHAWDGKWGDLVRAAADGCDPARLVWLDVFAVLQHPQSGQVDDLKALEDVILGTEHGTLLVWNPSLAQERPASNPVLRSWCLFEINTTVRANTPLLIKIGEQQDGRFALLGNPDEVTRLVYQLDIRNARATFDADRKRILASVEAQGGAEDLNTRVRTAVFNNWRIMSIPGVQAAVLGQREEVAAALASHDPATYAGDPGGTLLHDLVHGNFVQACKLVLDLGADVDARTAKGNAALHFAAEGGRDAIVDLLIARGAAIDLQNERGETALMLAAKYGREASVSALLEAGADVSLADTGNRTAADLAAQNKLPGCTAVRALLQQQQPGGGVPCCPVS